MFGIEGKSIFFSHVLCKAFASLSLIMPKSPSVQNLKQNILKEFYQETDVNTRDLS